jgi:hypothetical protein
MGGERHGCSPGRGCPKGNLGKMGRGEVTFGLATARAATTWQVMTIDTAGFEAFFFYYTRGPNSLFVLKNSR